MRVAGELSGHKSKCRDWTTDQAAQFNSQRGVVTDAVQGLDLAHDGLGRRGDARDQVAEVAHLFVAVRHCSVVARGDDAVPARLLAQVSPGFFVWKNVR